VSTAVESAYLLRWERLRALLESEGIDGMVVPPRYLSHLAGFCGDGWLVLARGESKPQLVLSSVERIEACEKVDRLTQVVTWDQTRDLPTTLARLIPHGARRLAYDPAHTSAGVLSQLRLSLGSLPDPPLLAALDGFEARLCGVKDSWAIAQLEKAARAADCAFNRLLQVVEAGVTELALAGEIDRAMRLAGADDYAFPTVVVSGPRSAYCHGRPTERTLEPGDLVTVDFGARVGEASSDLTRTLVIGPANDLQRRIHRVISRAHSAALREIRPGAEAGAVDAAARRAIEEGGYGHGFVHSLGHSLDGGPDLRAGSRQRLQVSNALTVEPGIYLDGWGGMRIEDDLLVTPDGYRLLTSSPRHLIEV